MQVNEIFYSIQGEGRYAGLPATFVRLQGCPVGCPFCDTKKSWSLSGDSRSLNLSPAQIVDSIRLMDSFKHHANPLLVITGGEPFYGQNGNELEGLLRAIGHNFGCRISIETSGTCFPASALLPGCDIHITVSPKYKPDGEGFLPVWREVFEIPGSTIDLKFLISGASQVPAYIDDFLTSYCPLGSEVAKTAGVFLQPIDFGEGNEAKTKRAEEQAVELSKEYGWRISLQLHKYLHIP